jgi:positive regulator of sigma E activity
MAHITAKVTSSDNGLVIEAARQSTCQHCDKQASCASQWQVTEPQHMIPVGAEIKEGDTVTLECTDQSLLLYFALLFLPSLSLLLIANVTLPFFITPGSALSQFAFQIILPLSFGAGCSRYLLHVFERKLKTATRFIAS